MDGGSSEGSPMDGGSCEGSPMDGGLRERSSMNGGSEKKGTVFGTSVRGALHNNLLDHKYFSSLNKYLFLGQKNSVPYLFFKEKESLVVWPTVYFCTNLTLWHR